MTKALRLGDFSLEEVVSLQNSDSWSVQFNPFLNGPGARQGGTFIRNSVAWKGFQRSGEPLQEFFDKLAGVSEGAAGAAAGLETINSRLEGGLEGSRPDGVSLVNYNGVTKVIPNSAVKVLVEASDMNLSEEEIVVASANSYNQLMQTNARARQQIRIPTVY